MANYLVDKLMDSLGKKGYSGNTGTVISDWTPNNIKCIVISRDFIWVGNHIGGIGGGRVTPLDQDKVLSDILDISMKNYGKPKLNSILERRALSCLEEIYVDSIFMKNLKVLDLESYVRKLFGSYSRLRRYGYFNPVRGFMQWILSNSESSRKKVGYLMSDDDSCPVEIGGTSGKFKGNPEWYKMYYLRPEYYKMDKEGGNLYVHFKKIEREYPKLIASAEEDEKRRGLQERLRGVYEKDLEASKYIERLIRCSKNLEERNNSFDIGSAKIVRSCFKNARKWKGLSEGFIKESSGELYEKLIPVYKYLKIVEPEGKGVSDIPKEEGFINLYEILDECCLKLADKVQKEGLPDLIKLTLSCCDIPEGKFKQKYHKNGNSYGSYEEFMKIISELVGCRI